MSHGCASQSISIVTAYDTLGPDGLAHSVNQTKCEYMFIDPHLLKTAAKPLENSSIKTLIVNANCIFAAGGEIEEFKKSHPDMRIVMYDELVQMGKDNLIDANPAKPSDLYCVMYTSGSSGLPKGACIKHESLIAGGPFPP